MLMKMMMTQMIDGNRGVNDGLTGSAGYDLIFNQLLHSTLPPELSRGTIVRKLKTSGSKGIPSIFPSIFRSSLVPPRTRCYLPIALCDLYTLIRGYLLRVRGPSLQGHPLADKHRIQMSDIPDTNPFALLTSPWPKTSSKPPGEVPFSPHTTCLAKRKRNRDDAEEPTLTGQTKKKRKGPYIGPSLPSALPSEAENSEASNLSKVHKYTSSSRYPQPAWMINTAPIIHPRPPWSNSINAPLTSDSFCPTGTEINSNKAAFEAPVKVSEVYESPSIGTAEEVSCENSNSARPSPIITGHERSNGRRPYATMPRPGFYLMRRHSEIPRPTFHSAWDGMLSSSNPPKPSRTRKETIPISDNAWLAGTSSSVRLSFRWSIVRIS